MLIRKLKDKDGKDVISKSNEQYIEFIVNIDSLNIGHKWHKEKSYMSNFAVIKCTLNELEASLKEFKESK